MRTLIGESHPQQARSCCRTYGKGQKNREGYVRRWEQHVPKVGGREEQADLDTNQTVWWAAQVPVSLGDMPARSGEPESCVTG